MFSPFRGRISNLLFGKFRGWSTEILLYISTEVGFGGEAEQGRHLTGRQLLAAQHTDDVERGVARYPKGGRVTAHLLGYFRQVFGSNAEDVGIIFYLAVMAVVASFEQGEKTIHQMGMLLGDSILVSIERGMEIEKVDYHGLNGIEHGIAMKLMVVERKATADVVKIECTYLLHLGCEVHEGIVEQGQASTNTIVALRSGKRDKLRGDIDHVHPELLALVNLLEQVTAAYNQAIAASHGVCLSVEEETAFPRMAVGMTQVSAPGVTVHAPQCVFKNHLLHAV